MLRLETDGFRDLVPGRRVAFVVRAILVFFGFFSFRMIVKISAFSRS